MTSRPFLGIFAAFVGLLLAGCGGANETSDSPSAAGGASGDGDDPASDGGSTGNNTGGASSGDGGDSSGSGGSSGSGSSSGSGGESTGAGGTSAGDGKNCDASTVVTDDNPEACPASQIREVVDETWGECVPLMDCGCDSPGSQAQCGDGLSYVCYQNGRCGDLLN